MVKRRKRRKGRRKLGKNEVYIMVFVTGLVVFAYAMAYDPSLFDIPASNVTSFINLFPGLIVSCIGIFFLSQSEGQGKFAGFLSLGVGINILLGYMNTESLLTSEILLGLTVPQLQLWTMVLSVLFGAVYFSFYAR